MTNILPAYRVTFDDGTTLETSMAKGVTLEDAKEYYIGTRFVRDDETTFRTGVSVQRLYKDGLWPGDKIKAYRYGMYKVAPPPAYRGELTETDWIEHIDRHNGWLFPIMPHPSENLVQVSKEKFYAILGPMDVNPNSQKYHTVWKTRGGTLVGWSTPGYNLIPHGAKKRYFIREDLV